MKKLAQADQVYLDAAEGWLGLGDYLSANDELDNISASVRAHPAVLAVRYEVFAVGKKWEMAVEIARSLSIALPDDPTGFVRYGFSLHELGHTAEALLVVEAAMFHFPEHWLLRFNAACYAAQLGDLKGAWQYLERAIDLGDPKKVKLLALEDKDLEPLWAGISEI
jgi:tetratricopeptide (TPR) repeat protein